MMGLANDEDRMILAGLV